MDRVDVAPTPSARFPASWYPAGDNTTATTTAPVVGVPFTGTTVMTTKIDMGKGHSPSESRISTVTTRDSAGRTRIEEGAAQFQGADGSGDRMIEVNDVVRHCSFRWAEPARDVQEKVAHVSCIPLRLSWTQDGMEAKMTRRTPDVVVFPGQTDKMEPLAEKTVAGLRALGVRQTRTITMDNGKTGGFVMQIWWSPELKELLKTEVEGDPNGIPVFAMSDIRRGEPDSALFYPPDGWRIERTPEEPPMPVP